MQRARRLVHRPATRRAELPDRTPPLPNMPRASLRHAQHLIRSHCDNLGITYTESSLIGSYVAALRHLNRLGKTATHLDGRPDTTRRESLSTGGPAAATESAL